jgi:hypothetical protein
MTEEKNHADMDKAMFVNLVMMLGTSAMQQLGKLVNPATRKAEVDLEGAQMTIDMLTMLQAKTKGNLSREEERVINELVASLQMNYVQTASATPSPAEEDAKEKPADRPPTPEGPSESNSAPPAPDAGAEEKKEPKFRKSYGGG